MRVLSDWTPSVPRDRLAHWNVCLNIIYCWLSLTNVQIEKNDVEFVVVSKAKQSYRFENGENDILDTQHLYTLIMPYYDFF